KHSGICERFPWPTIGEAALLARCVQDNIFCLPRASTNRSEYCFMVWSISAEKFLRCSHRKAGTFDFIAPGDCLPSLQWPGICIELICCSCGVRESPWGMFYVWRG